MPKQRVYKSQYPQHRSLLRYLAGMDALHSPLTDIHTMRHNQSITNAYEKCIIIIGGINMGIGLLLIIAVALALLFDNGAFIKRFLSNTDISRSDGQNTPRQILDVRLARGEIGPEEYESIRRQLETTEVVL